MNVLLIASYELGRPSFGITEAAAWLRDAGSEVACLDLAVEELDPGRVRRAEVIAFHVPMHTATRIALDRLPEVRALNPSAHLCFYGLYAPLHEEHLRARGVQTVLGGESETSLVAMARRLSEDRETRQAEPVISVGRQRFLTPDRSVLPPPKSYARLVMPDGEERVAGYTEASRGCRHLCRHCPVVPIYDGRFRVVDRDVVLDDIRQQVEAGAEHITFGDPDFLNGPGHVLPIVQAMHRQWPQLTYDATIKVEHLVQRGDLLPELRRTGCLFVTSAVESVDDRILQLLEKGHDRADVERAIRDLEAIGLPLTPTFIPFTPWTSLEGYRELLAWVMEQGLVDRVAPIQLAIRLLLPPGSRLLDLEDVTRVTDGLDPESLTYPWTHPDPQMDVLARDVMATVEELERGDRARREIFAALWSLAHGGRETGDLRFRSGAAPAPRISEPWYCCAEPPADRMATV